MGRNGDRSSRGASSRPVRVAHLTTVDLTLHMLLRAQLQAVSHLGGEPMGISAPGPWVDSLEEAGVRHLALPSSTRGMSLRSDVRAVGQLWRILRRERVDILHTHNPKPGLYGRVVGRLAGVPIIVNTVHGLYAAEDDHLAKRTLVNALEWFASRWSDIELVQSAEDVARMRRLHIGRRGAVRHLGNGVDLERFNPDRWRAAGESTRRELGISPTDVVVGTVGRLVREKGLPELFDAMRTVGSGYTLVVVGPEDPEKADALPRAMVEEAASKGVRFVGLRTDVERFYAAMDIFVLPSHREGMPRSAMEASAMGIPIVATDIRGCREVVADGVTGLLVRCRDARALAAAITALGDDPSRRAAMGIAGHERAAQLFDEKQVVSRVIDAYRDAASRSGRAARHQLEARLVGDPAMVRTESHT